MCFRQMKVLIPGRQFADSLSVSSTKRVRLSARLTRMIRRLTALRDRGAGRRGLWIALVSLICLAIVGGGALIYVIESENSLDFDEVRFVSIPPDSDIESIMDSLQSSGVLNARWSFRYLVRLTGWGSQIKAGRYEFASGVSNRDMLATLRAGLQVQVRVTIPAGSRPETIAESAARNMAFDADEFLAALYSEELASELGTDTLHLFAYMLPDTYFFYWLTEPEAVIRRMKATADEVIAGAAHEGSILDSHDKLVNLAAIVEWETSLVEEKARVAGVYVNRLRRDWPLQADPTVQLAVLASEGSKRRLRYSDYAVAHPYNTYLFTGLPPGPITNPTASSLRAAAAPEEHSYFFFVASPNGGHAFNATLGGHNRDAAALRRHLRSRKQQATQEDS